ncbi:MAG: hypothetical protein GY765_10555 [bacterium]|nr:hypothetical protein [bacterium]
MQKLIALFVLLILCSSLRSDVGSYIRGTIVLKGIDHFGEKSDWEGLFYDKAKNMVAAPNGSIFVSNANQHTIYKFDKATKRYLKMNNHQANGNSKAAKIISCPLLPLPHPKPAAAVPTYRRTPVFSPHSRISINAPFLLKNISPTAKIVSIRFSRVDFRETRRAKCANNYPMHLSSPPTKI